jgi:cellulose synthase/poly-beta-1,6-N-acetylglucosamine synthase-like glycosyltransferase
MTISISIKERKWKMAFSWIDGVFFFYMFVGCYMLSLFLFIYIQNRKNLFYYPTAKPEPVSIVVPCYNEEDTIGKTIESLLKLDYPKELIEIIVVDDHSKDNSAKVAKEYAKKYSNVKVIVNEKNSGGAAEPTNIGVRAAKYNYIAVTDGDSSPQPDALKKMLGFLQEDEKVGAVTCAVLVKNQETLMQKLQAIEYIVIGFGRKMLDFVDSVYVTPGPFALYRKKTLVEVGLFDTKNLTQDIEIVWRLIAHGYKARMCLAAKVYSDAPKKLRQWWRQRVRWNIGGTQSILKHRKALFKNGMLGAFIIPYFTASLFLGIFGLCMFIYLTLRRFLYLYLSTRYSIYAQTAVLTMQDLTFSPTILNYFGVVMLILGGGFTFVMLSVTNEPSVKSKNIINVVFYQIVYLTIYPFIMIHGLSKLIRKKYSW